MNELPTVKRAFPFTIPAGNGHGEMTHMGLTAREYYAAHAPDVPEWFKGSPSPVRPDPPVRSNSMFADEEYRELVAWTHGSRCADTLPNVSGDAYVKWALRWQKYCQAEILHAEGGDERRWFAWRWHYSDMMLKEGK